MKHLLNIAHYTIVAFLVCAISGLTLTVHHEHHLKVESIPGAHETDGHDGVGGYTTASTYHETHLIKLLSGDNFDACKKIEPRSFHAGIFVLNLDLSSTATIYRLVSFSNSYFKDTGPPSVDKYVLFCSYLI